MALTRRHFVEALSVAGASLLNGAATAAAAQSAVASPARGASAADVAPLIKLDQNENPYGPGPSVTRAVMEAVNRGNRYPSRAAGGDLTDAIAALHGVARENVILGAGSGELLKSSVLAFVDGKRHLVAGLPTFETCTGAAKSMGYPVREVPVDGSLRLDLPAMETAAAGAGLVFFCNPNNPTGTTWPTRDLESMIDRLAAASPDTVILVDEAYAHFVERSDYASLAARAAGDRRILVTRTFSKVFGLAGMRVGYGVGHKDTIATLRRSTTSGLIPVTSAAAALAALKDEALIRQSVERNREARASATKMFQDLGFPVLPSDANFVLVDVKRPPEVFQAACRERGVLVGRPFPGLKTHSRISFGTAEEMKRAAAVFKAVLSLTA
ncbi:MAG: aminotransferase class I/II-fold pyridoxal phosphate-dependent enzyme [Vicinamibacteria bacterium]